MATLSMNFNGTLVRTRPISDRFLSGALALFMCVFLSACSWTVDTVLSDLNLMLQTGNVVCGTLGVVSPGDSVACQAVAAVGIAAINVIQTTYDEYKADPSSSNLQRVQNALAAIKTNLPAALAAAHIVDPNAVRLVTDWVNLIVSTADTVIGLIPQLQASARAVTTKKGTFSLPAAFPTPESLQARWQTEVCRGNIPCGKLVKVHYVHAKWVHVVTLGVAR